MFLLQFLIKTKSKKLQREGKFKFAFLPPEADPGVITQFGSGLIVGAGVGISD